ncbi:MAG: hypothetical protein HFK09_06150 [Clostridia bacterium]|nr:hypothetical protein [Clostridia bacterium]
MKKTRLLIALLLAVCVGVGTLCFAGCKDTDPPEEKALPEFVAVDKTNWDKEVTFGERKFKLRITLESENKLTLAATCTGKAATGGGPGGPGGMPFSATAVAEGETEEETETEEDLKKFDFTYGGTWSEEKGWGYTFKFDDEAKTETKVNYDKVTGRHEFFYTMTPTVDGKKAESTVQFQATDSDYRKTLDANYVIYEERTAEYMFHGGGFDSMTGNKKEARIYLLPEGKVVCYSESGSSLTYSNKGSWSVDAARHELALNVNGTDCATSYCDTAGKEGYRATYSGMDCYCSLSDGFHWGGYTAEDFDGKSLLLLNGSYSAMMGGAQACTLSFTDKNTAIFRNPSGMVFSVPYTKDGDVYKFTVDGTEYATEKNGNDYSVTVKIKVQNGPFGTSEMTVPMSGSAA